MDRPDHQEIDADILEGPSLGPDDFESELEYFRYIARRFQASSDKMLSDLRLLQNADVLSEEDRAFINEEIPQYEALARTWKLRRFQLGQTEE
jgi:hypothetical protein